MAGLLWHFRDRTLEQERWQAAASFIRLLLQSHLYQEVFGRWTETVQASFTWPLSSTYASSFSASR